jgi:hypothetical protein
MQLVDDTHRRRVAAHTAAGTGPATIELAT